MLKLEKRRKSSEITIGLREKAPFFDRLLWRALLIAISFHLAGIILFHIRPFVIQSTFIYPPRPRSLRSSGHQPNLLSKQ